MPRLYCFIFGLLCAMAQSSAQPMVIIDSLEKRLPTVGVDSQRVDILTQLVSYYMRFDMDKAQKKLNEAMTATDQEWGNYASWAKRRAGIQYQYGNYLVRLSDGPGALPHFNQALELYKKINLLKGIGNVLTGIGSVYHMLGDIDHAEESLNDAVSYYEKAGFQEGLFVVTLNLADLYGLKQQYQVAIQRLHAIEHLVNEPKFVAYYPSFYANLGKNYAAIDSLEKGQEYIRMALEAIPEGGDMRVFGVLCHHLSNIYILLNRYDKVREYAEKGLETGKKINSPFVVLGCAENLQSVHTTWAAQTDIPALKDSLYLKAFYYNNLAKSANDSIYNTEKSMQLAEFQARYETEKKEREITQLSAEAKDREIYLLRQESALRQEKIKVQLAKEEALILEKNNQNYQLELALNSAKLSEEKTAALQKQAQIETLNLENQRRVEQAARNRKTLYLLLIGLLALSALLFFTLRLYWQKRVAQQKIERQSAEIKNQNTELEQANRFKSIFLSNMSHEIRTPISTIIGISGLLNETELGPKQKEYTNIIAIASQNLLSVINEILDFSKIEAGKIELRPEPFDLHQLLHQQISIFGVEAGKKGLQLRLEINPQTPRHVVTDPGRLNQIILNLLGNAVKFTQSGMIALRVEPGEINGQFALKIRVEDTGIGIDPSELPYVFDAFKQAGQSTHLQQSGTGLGLAICKQLVELQHGAIGAESVPGKGSKFYFTLPVEIAEQTTTPPVPAYTIQKRPFCKILLVEDNTFYQMLACELLQKIIDHPEITTAQNGFEALDRLSSGVFDLILMDVKMPKMDGYSATGKIREMGINTPIIALTANAASDEYEQCINAGMNDYLTKPLDLSLLYEKVAKWVIK